MKIFIMLLISSFILYNVFSIKNIIKGSKRIDKLKQESDDCMKNIATNIHELKQYEQQRIDETKAVKEELEKLNKKIK